MSKQLGTVDIDELVSGEDRAIEDALRTLALEVNAKLALWVFGVGLAPTPYSTRRLLAGHAAFPVECAVGVRA